MLQDYKVLSSISVIHTSTHDVHTGTMYTTLLTPRDSVHFDFALSGLKERDVTKVYAIMVLSIERWTDFGWWQVNARPTVLTSINVMARPVSSCQMPQQQTVFRRLHLVLGVLFCFLHSIGVVVDKQREANVLWRWAFCILSSSSADGYMLPPATDERRATTDDVEREGSDCWLFADYFLFKSNFPSAIDTHNEHHSI